jgi:hypothetical protein
VNTMYKLAGGKAVPSTANNETANNEAANNN